MALDTARSPKILPLMTIPPAAVILAFSASPLALCGTVSSTASYPPLVSGIKFCLDFFEDEPPPEDDKDELDDDNEDDDDDEDEEGGDEETRGAAPPEEEREGKEARWPRMTEESPRFAVQR